MNKDEARSFMNDLFKSYSTSYKAKDDQKLDIACRKKGYEDTLDEMWRIYSTGNFNQLAEYNKQVEIIKGCGCKVYRNSQGKHRIKIA